MEDGLQKADNNDITDFLCDYFSLIIIFNLES